MYVLPSHRSIVDNIGKQQFLLENESGEGNNGNNHNHNKKIKSKSNNHSNQNQSHNKDSFKENITTTTTQHLFPPKSSFVSHFLTFSIITIYYLEKKTVKYDPPHIPSIYPLSTFIRSKLPITIHQENVLAGLVGLVGPEVVNDATVKRTSCEAKVCKRCSAEDQGDKLATTLGT